MTAKVLTSKRMFDGRMVRVRVDTLQMDSGVVTHRDVVEHPGAAVVVPLDAQGRILMVRQYRHAVRETLLELPAGVIDPGEDPADTALRELREETGFAARSLTPLQTFYASPGFTDERLHCYLAKDLEPSPLTGDPDEDIEVVPIPVEDLAPRTAVGGITDGKTLAGLFLFFVNEGVLLTNARASAR